MNRHYCKIGAITPVRKIGLSRAELERRYKLFWQKAYDLTQTDAGLSDFFNHEADKILRYLNRLETK